MTEDIAKKHNGGKFVLIPNRRPSSSSSNPAQVPELLAEGWDEVRWMVWVGGLDEVVVGIGCLLGTFDDSHLVW